MKFHHLDLLLSCPLSTIYIVCCNISIFSCFILISFHFEELFKACKEQVIINPIQDEHFRGCSRMEGAKSPPSLKSLTHILQWWNLAQLYLTWRRSKKYVTHVTHPLSFADITIFSPGISKFCYIKKYRHRLHFNA